MSALQRYFIELAYNGTNYHGWQTQPNAVTVQELLDKALQTVLRTKIETTGAGRTDTGVHARQLFVHFNVVEDVKGKMENVEGKMEGVEGKMENVKGKMENVEGNMEGGEQSTSSIFHDTSSLKPTSSIFHDTSSLKPTSSIFHDTSSLKPTSSIKRSLNALLPPDISVKRIIPVHADAHARFDATLRSYEYHVHFEKDPFLHNFSWQLRDRPDMGLMNKAAAILMEFTDFSCFSKSNTQVKTNNCKISRAEWVADGDKMIFHISADRFLRNMVRAIVGTLMMVGKKEIEPEAVRQIIESKNRSNAGTSVPACGLYLTEVRYPYIGPPNSLKGEPDGLL